MDSTVALVVILTALLLRTMGRTWGPPATTPLSTFLYNPSANSSLTSQTMSDPYTFSHILHGLVFYWGLSYTSLSFDTKLLIATVLESAWELSENTQAVIDKYRSATASLGYEGDSVLNSTCDILAMIAGFYLASVVSWEVSLLAFLGTEFWMAWRYRDNLTTNVLMLLLPAERTNFIKQWQLAGSVV